VVDEAQPESDASMTRTPSRSVAAFSATPTRFIPPTSRPDSASAPSPHGSKGRARCDAWFEIHRLKTAAALSKRGVKIGGG
jgi:hypothetical protein